MSKSADRKATKRYNRKVRVDQQNRTQVEKMMTEFARQPTPDLGIIFQYLR